MDKFKKYKEDISDDSNDDDEWRETVATEQLVTENTEANQEATNLEKPQDNPVQTISSPPPNVIEEVKEQPKVETTSNILDEIKENVEEEEQPVVEISNDDYNKKNSPEPSNDEDDAWKDIREGTNSSSNPKEVKQVPSQNEIMEDSRIEPDFFKEDDRRSHYDNYRERGGYSNDGFQNRRGFGRGGFYNEGFSERGRGRGRSRGEMSDRGRGEMSDRGRGGRGGFSRGFGRGGKIVCYNCGQEGHMSRECPNPRNRESSNYSRTPEIGSESRTRGNTYSNTNWGGENGRRNYNEDYNPKPSIYASNSRYEDKTGRYYSDNMRMRKVDDYYFDSNAMYYKEFPNLEREIIYNITNKCKTIDILYREKIILNECFFEVATRDIDLIGKEPDVGEWITTFAAAEMEMHKKYLTGYKIYSCQKNMHHDISSCFDYHSSQERRRIPKWKNNRWNYYPLPCPTKCMDEACLYSHNPFEMKYHPLRYKTKLCEFEGANSFICSQYGEKCYNAHSKEDLRNLKQCITNLQKMSPDIPQNFTPERQSIMDQFQSLSLTTNYSQQIPSTPGTGGNLVALSQILTDFNLDTFKTIPCPNPSCPNKRCLYFHNEFERRRNPSKFQYENQFCQYTFQHGKFLSPSKCPSGDNCNLVHTKNEFYYHKTRFRKMPCKRKPCPYGDFCPDLHSLQSGGTNDEMLQLLRISQLWKCDYCKEFISEEKFYFFHPCFHKLCQKCALEIGKGAEDKKECTICQRKINKLAEFLLIPKMEPESTNILNQDSESDSS